MIVPDDQAKVGPTSITPPSLCFAYSSSLSPLLFFSFRPLSAHFLNHLLSSSQMFFTDTSGPPLQSPFRETKPRHMDHSFRFWASTHALLFHPPGWYSILDPAPTHKVHTYSCPSTGATCGRERVGRTVNAHRKWIDRHSSCLLLTGEMNDEQHVKQETRTPFKTLDFVPGRAWPTSTGEHLSGSKQRPKTEWWSTVNMPRPRPPYQAWSPCCVSCWRASRRSGHVWSAWDTARV